MNGKELNEMETDDLINYINGKPSNNSNSKQGGGRKGKKNKKKNKTGKYAPGLHPYVCPTFMKFLLSVWPWEMLLNLAGCSKPKYRVEIQHIIFELGNIISC